MDRSARSRRFRYRLRLRNRKSRLRVSVFRSSRYIYAQVIEDLTGRTLASAGSHELSRDDTSPMDVAREVGSLLAKRCASYANLGFVYDRGGYTYTGRVQRLFEGFRSAIDVGQ